MDALHGSFCVVMGMVGTGKTSICREYLLARPNETGVVICDSHPFQKPYRELVKGHIFDDFLDTGTFFQHLLDIPATNPDYVILDECFWDLSVCLEPAFVHLVDYCVTNRKTLIITMPYAMGLSDEIRAKVSCVVVLREGIKPNIRRIHNAYTHWYLSLDELTTRLLECREDACSFWKNTCLICSDGRVTKHVINT